MASKVAPQLSGSRVLKNVGFVSGAMMLGEGMWRENMKRCYFSLF